MEKERSFFISVYYKILVFNKKYKFLIYLYLYNINIIKSFTFLNKI